MFRASRLSIPVPGRWLAIFWCALAPGAFSAAAELPVRPIPAVEHVLVISVDGLRPDLALRANMPNLRMMLHNGSYTFWARTTDLAVTLPSHTSMLTGVTPAKHGVDWNSDLGVPRTRYPKVPTVMEMATRAGYVTAMVAGKSKFSALDKPGSINHSYYPMGPNGSVSDAVVADRAIDMIERFQPGLLFIHFPEVDAIGHSVGWATPAQISAIERLDAQLGRIFAALQAQDLRDKSVVILSADHGGAGRNHGAGDVRSRYIPWIIVGPGVKSDFDLTQEALVEVHTEDTAATVCYLLGLARPGYFDGKPVRAAF